MFYAFQIDQVKDSRTFNQIPRSKPSRIGQKTMEPFQAHFLKPSRRAALFSREKVDRSTDTQSDPPHLRVISNVAGEDLLLRHSYREEN